MKKSFIFLIIGSITLTKVDLVLYSFDRPIQLFALLESISTYFSGINNCSVIVRASNSKFKSCYEEVQENFKQFNFLFQGDNPHSDFKDLLLKSADLNGNGYIMFGVDDIIVKDYVNLAQCANKLEETQAYSLFLRLGCNIDYCYSLNCPTPLPAHQIVKDVIKWQFKDGAGDWDYPNNNDMTLYRKKDALKCFNSIPLRSTAYEGDWASLANHNLYGICFRESKIVNIPLNIVNEEYRDNKSMNAYTTEELLNIFKKNLKIDITPFHKVQNKSAHQEYQLKFIRRK